MTWNVVNYRKLAFLYIAISALPTDRDYVPFRCKRFWQETDWKHYIYIYIDKISASPSILYGCEIWTLKQRDIRKTRTADMKFTIRTAGYSSLHHRSDDTSGLTEDVSKSFRTVSISKYTLTTINTRWEATQRVMAAKLARLIHKIAIQLHLLAESCTIPVLAPGGQSGNFRIHARKVHTAEKKLAQYKQG
jgi:hypothetical protein